jgi:hypothetical protein
MNRKANYNSSNFKIFGIFLILIGLFSCDLNVNEEIIEYVIINDSDYLIEIIPAPATNFRDTKTKIILRRNDTYSGTRLWNERFDSGKGFRTFLGTDSVNIIFGNERKIIYSSISSNNFNNCDDSRNLLLTSPELGTKRVEYLFTNQDFDCATICPDECI